MNQRDIFSAGAQTLQMTDSIELTVQSLLVTDAAHRGEDKKISRSD